MFCGRGFPAPKCFRCGRGFSPDFPLWEGLPEGCPDAVAGRRQASDAHRTLTGSPQHPAKQPGRHGVDRSARPGRAGACPTRPCHSHRRRDRLPPQGGRRRADSSPNGSPRTTLPSALSPQPKASACCVPRVAVSNQLTPRESTCLFALEVQRMAEVNTRTCSGNVIQCSACMQSAYLGRVRLRRDRKQWRCL